MYLRCAVWRPNTIAALLIGDWKTRRRGKGGRGGGGGMNRQKTQHRSTVNKESSVYSALKDSGIPHHTPALQLRGVNRKGKIAQLSAGFIILQTLVWKLICFKVTVNVPPLSPICICSSPVPEQSSARVCVQVSKVTLRTQRQRDGLFFLKNGVKFLPCAAGWPTPL